MAEHINNDKLYELLDRTRMELKSDNLRLEAKFDGLVEGRVAKLEEEVSGLRVAVATAGTKLLILGFISSCIVGAVISAVIERMFK